MIHTSTGNGIDFLSNFVKNPETTKSEEKVIGIHIRDAKQEIYFNDAEGFVLVAAKLHKDSYQKL